MTDTHSVLNSSGQTLVCNILLVMEAIVSLTRQETLETEIKSIPKIAHNDLLTRMDNIVAKHSELLSRLDRLENEQAKVSKSQLETNQIPATNLSSTKFQTEMNTSFTIS